MQSLPLLLDVVQRERDAQLTHFDSLDSKAGVLLGFAAAEIALAPDLGRYLRILSLLVLALAAVTAAAAFWPRGYPALDATRLRDYLNAEVSFTQLTLHDTLIEMLGEGAEVLRRKGRLLRASTVLLAMGSLILGSGLAIGASHG